MDEIPAADQGKVIRDAIELLEIIKSNEGLHYQDIFEESSIDQDVIHTHLEALEEKNYLTEDKERYKLGHRFVHMSETIRKRPEYKLASEKVDEIANKTKHRTYFVVESQGRGIYLFVNPGEFDIRTKSAPGNWLPLHAAAAGKAILSHLPKNRVNNIIDQWGLPKQTENTITDRERLFEEIEEIKERGYAVNREEQTKGLQAVGAPVLGVNDDVIGALSVGGPVHRIDESWFRDKLPDIVLAATNELELMIAYS